MHKNLIIRAFQKAREDRIENGDNDPSKTNISEDIADYLEEQCGWKITSERLKQYLLKANNIKIKKEDINIPQIGVVYGLCNYLGFSSYQDFKISTASRSEKIRYFLSKNKTMLIINAMTIVTCIVVTITSGQRWMVWDGLKYEEVSFSIQKLESGELELYNADKIRNFRKIPNPNCDTKYFNEKGEKTAWYYKRGKNDLEIFTSPGIHPVNGKTLDDITLYMIREHICPEY